MRKNRSGIYILTAAAIAVNFLLFILKLYIGLSSSSLCIYSDSVNNLFDMFSCSFAFAGLIIMKKAANSSYPDGYGKAEDVAGFVMSVIIGITGVYFAYLAVERFMYPRPVNYLLGHALLLGGTIAVKLVLGIVTYKYSRKDDSVILKTVYMDSFADCGVTGMTLISFILSEYSGLRVDAVFGLGISIIIIVNAIKLIKASLEGLMGKNDEEKINEINTLITEAGFEVIKLRIYKAGESFVAAADIRGNGETAAMNEKAANNFNVQLYLKKE